MSVSLNIIPLKSVQLHKQWVAVRCKNRWQN